MPVETLDAHQAYDVIFRFALELRGGRRRPTAGSAFGLVDLGSVERYGRIETEVFRTTLGRVPKQ